MKYAIGFILCLSLCINTVYYLKFREFKEYAIEVHDGLTNHVDGIIVINAINQPTYLTGPDSTVYSRMASVEKVTIYNNHGYNLIFK